MLAATIALAVITGIYVILTGFIAKEARRSSEAAGQAAVAASRAANANTRSAVVAEISLKTDFHVELLKEDRDFTVVVTFIGRSAVINIFKADVSKVILSLEGDKEITLQFPETSPADPLPLLLSRGQYTGFVIRFEPDVQELAPLFAVADCRIEYGFDQTNPEAAYPFTRACLWQMSPPVREARRRGLEEAQRTEQVRRGLEAAQPTKEPGVAAWRARKPKWLRWPW
jgi:hypothetical protein